ncbi:MAG: hypothetical protein M0R03_11040 [Novosphingobium sp.]|nr:hypothetical protein [Novosphingobium sp.]
MNKIIKDIIKKEKLKLGEARPMYKCCRQIRIQFPNEIGKIYSGVNTMTEEEEKWICIKVTKNCNNNILQRVI